MDGPSQDVVNTYLSSGESIPPNREWHDLTTAPGNDFVRLRAVRICNRNGEVTVSVDIRQPVTIEIEYEVLNPGLALMPHFTLNNQAGLCIFVGIDQDPEWQGRPRPVGSYISKAQIPGNLLIEGSLFVGPAMRTVDPDIFHFWVDKAVGFELIDSLTGKSAKGEWVKSTPGVIRPMLQWSTDYDPNGTAVPSSIKTKKTL